MNMKYNQPVDFVADVNFESVVQVPTAPQNDNSQRVASTAYVDFALSNLELDKPKEYLSDPTFTASVNTVYFVDTTVNPVVVTLPTVVFDGDRISFYDSKGTFDINNLVINSLNYGIGVPGQVSLVLNLTGSSVELTYWNNVWVLTTAVSLPSSSRLQIEYLNSSTLGKCNFKYLVDTSVDPVSVTLPLAPANGTEIAFVDFNGTFSVNSLLVVSTGTDTIFDLTETEVLLDVDHSYLLLIYYDSVWHLGYRSSNLIGDYDYITYNQGNLTLNQIDLSTDVTGLLPIDSVSTLSDNLDSKVDKAGSPLQNQLAVWQGSSSLANLPNLVFDGSLKLRYGNYSAVGDAQSVSLVLLNQTVNATANVALTTDTLAPTLSNCVTPPEDTVYRVEISVTAVVTAVTGTSTAVVGQVSTWTLKGVVKNVASVLSVNLSTPTVDLNQIGLSTPTVQVVNTDKVSVTVTGLLNTTIRWLADCNISSISW